MFLSSGNREVRKKLGTREFEIVSCQRTRIKITQVFLPVAKTDLAESGTKKDIHVVP